MTRCPDCAHYRAGWCTNGRDAQLGRMRYELGDLAQIEQHCIGYREAKRDSEKQTTRARHSGSIKA
jgi:hypothetical protein